MKASKGVKTNLQILLIEDDPADAFRLNHVLTRAGVTFHARRVETRDEFLRALRQEPPDVILSDHGLPSFDGFTALDIVQKQFPQIPFIFVTGSNDQAMMLETFEGGAAGYVYKNQISDLVPTLEQVLAKAAISPEPQPVVPEAPAAAPQEAPASHIPGVQRTMICSDCKKIRDEQGQWVRMRAYFQENREATVMLAICPACAAARRGHGF